MDDDPKDEARVPIRRVLTVGLDGVPFDLLTPLFARGVMPFLASLLEDSYHAELLSTVPPISATAWTSVITGANPGRHGILQFVNLQPDGPQSQGAHEIFPGGFSLVNASSIRSTTLWSLLAAAGKRQVVINVPMTYPPCRLDGIMVTGMMTPLDAEIFTHPPELSARLREAGYEIDLSVTEKEFDYDPALLIGRLHALLLKRSDAGLQLLREEPWDFSMIVFTSTDRLQHRFWKYLVAGAPEYRSPEAVRLRPLLDEYFQLLDQALARLIESAGPETLTILLSDHGFGPVSARTVHRLSMMSALGLAQDSSRSGIVRLRNVVEGRLGLTPDRLRKLVRGVLPRKWVSQVDASARRAQLAAVAGEVAYSVTLHEYVGGIYINRERLRLRGEAYETFRQQITSKLQDLVDPANRAPLVVSVHTREELYAGPALDKCPDVVFTLAPGYGLSGGFGPAGALVSPRRSDPNKQGTHRDRGILLLHGPGVTPMASGPQRLLDVTATILYALDVAIPSAMDSRPILSAFGRKFVEQQPPRYQQAELAAIDDSVTTPGSGPILSREDHDQLMERLRAWGYVE